MSSTGSGEAKGSMNSKVTITLNKEKAATARVLANAASTSEVIDMALDLLIRAERTRHDVIAYQENPPTQFETFLAKLGDTSNLADDTDWESLYPSESL